MDDPATESPDAETADAESERAADADVRGARASPAALVALSADLLAAVRTGDATDEHVERIAGLDGSALDALSDDPSAAKAFWINCYNAAAQLAIEDLEDPLEHKRALFGGRRFVVAGRPRSLDDIEHGILRRSLSKYGLGYVPSLTEFPVVQWFLGDEFERRHRLDDVDPRIHFALNCGARSCPAIRAYGAERIDEELDAATRAHLETDAEYDPEAGVVSVPRVMLWFRGDFGGRSGIYAFLERYDVVPAGERPRVSYREYDWTLTAATFADA